MQETIERLAVLSIARACAFACLGIFTTMAGLAWDPPLAARAGGLLMLLTCAVLVHKAVNARTRSYKRTELWMLLPEDERPAPVVAQYVIGEALRQTYFRFALHAGLLGCALGSVGLFLKMLDQ